MKRYPGVVIGTVKSLDDPCGEGRIQVAFPWLPHIRKYPWAPVAVPFAGKDRGLYFYPEIDDEVLIAFEHGDFDHPFVIGFLWNGVDKPPSDNHRKRLFRSVNKHEIEVFDSDGSGGDKGYIRIKDAHGNVIELANARITISSVATLELQALNVSINGRPVANVGPPI